MCQGKNGEKMKTKHLLPKLKAEGYVRAPVMEVLNKCQYLSRAYIMSMFRMLDCGSNFKIGHGGVNFVRRANTLPSNIRESKSVNIFKNTYDAYMKREPSSHIIQHNLA